MCGRFFGVEGITDTWANIWENLNFEFVSPSYNIAPSQLVPVIRNNDETQKREIVPLQWGLIPFWAKDKSIGFKTINARSETLAEKPSFKAAYQYRRAIIPASGFIEWQRVGKKKKQPFAMTLADKDAPMGFAGLWESWENPDVTQSEVIETFTIITTEANELVSQVHDRMPVILQPADFEVWMNAGQQDSGALKHLLIPYPAQQMQAHPINPLINSVANNSLEYLAPYESKGETLEFDFS